jgi:rhodanese-related sulfurtransferase
MEARVVAEMADSQRLVSGLRPWMWILGLSLVIGLGRGWMVGWPPSAADDPYRMEVSMVVDGAVLWVDARSPELVANEPYPAAVPLYSGAWDQGFGELLTAWDGVSPIVVFCDGAACAASKEVAARLRTDLGFEQVYWLADGWDALKERQAGDE